MLADVMQKISIPNGPLTRTKDEKSDKKAFSEILSSTMNRENGESSEMKIKETSDTKVAETADTEGMDETSEVPKDEAVKSRGDITTEGEEVLLMMNPVSEMKTENQMPVITLEGITTNQSVEETKSAVYKPLEESKPLSEFMGRKQNELLSLKDHINEKDPKVIEIPKDQGKIISDKNELVKETSGKPELFMEALKNAVSDEKSLQKENGKLPLEKEISTKLEAFVTKADVTKTDLTAKDALKELSSTGIDPAMKLETLEESKDVKDFKEIYQAMEAKEPVKDVTTSSDDGTKVEGSLLPMNEAKAVSNQAVSEKVSPKSFDFEKSFDNATEEIMKSMETIKEGGKTTMKVNLHPDEMGKMEITLTMEDGKLSGKILLDNREIRQIFTERLEELSNNLKQNSIQIGKFEVGVGDKGEGNQGRQESRQQMQNPFRGYYNRKSENEIYPVSPERDLKEINLLA